MNMFKEFYSKRLRGAILRKDPEKMELYLSKGADPDYYFQTRENKLSLLTHLRNLFEYADYDDFDDVDFNEMDGLMEKMIMVLIEGGADLTVRNHQQYTCLRSCIRSTEITKLLISKGIDLNARASDRKTALHACAEEGYTETLELLIKAGADPHIKTGGIDALFISALCDNQDIFDHLVSTVSYKPEHLANAYKVLGVSLLDHPHMLRQTRRAWEKAAQYNEISKPSSKTSYKSIPSGVNCCTLQDAVKPVEFTTRYQLDLLDDAAMFIQSHIIRKRLLKNPHPIGFMRYSFYQIMEYLAAHGKFEKLLKVLCSYNTFFLDKKNAMLCLAKLLNNMLTMYQSNPERSFYDETIVPFVRQIFDWIIEQFEMLKRDKFKIDKHRLYVNGIQCELMQETVKILCAIVESIGTNDEIHLVDFVQRLIKVNPIYTSARQEEYNMIKMIIKYTKPDHGNQDANRASQLIKIFIDQGMHIRDSDIKFHDIYMTNPYRLTLLPRSEPRNQLLKLMLENGAHFDHGYSTDRAFARGVAHCYRGTSINPFDYTTLACLAARELKKLKAKPLKKHLSHSQRKFVRMH